MPQKTINRGQLRSFWSFILQIFHPTWRPNFHFYLFFALLQQAFSFISSLFYCFCSKYRSSNTVWRPAMKTSTISCLAPSMPTPWEALGLRMPLTPVCTRTRWHQSSLSSRSQSLTGCLSLSDGKRPLDPERVRESSHRVAALPTCMRFAVPAIGFILTTRSLAPLPSDP